MGLTIDAYVQLRWVKVKVGASSFAIQINSRGQLKSPGNCMKFLLNLQTLKLILLFKAPRDFKIYIFKLNSGKTALDQTTYIMILCCRQVSATVQICLRMNHRLPCV